VTKSVIAVVFIIRTQSPATFWRGASDFDLPLVTSDGQSRSRRRAKLGCRYYRLLIGWSLPSAHVYYRKHRWTDKTRTVDENNGRNITLFVFNVSAFVSKNKKISRGPRVANRTTGPNCFLFFPFPVLSINTRTISGRMIRRRQFVFPMFETGN